MRLAALVTAVLMLTLAGVNAVPAQETPGSGTWALPAPHARTTTDAQIYPREAVSRGIEGRVLAAFDITTDGKTANVAILWTENPLLAEPTRQALLAYQFQVPPDWAQTGARRRWRMGFVYCLPPSDQPGDFVLPVDISTIKAARPAALPVARHPDSHRSVLCASP
jgi:hypothetical protein